MASAETVLNSDTKIQILRTLSLSDRSYSAETLEDTTTKDITSIYKALEDLRDENIVKVIQTEGKTKYYKINSEKPPSDILESAIRFPTLIATYFGEEAIQYDLEDLPPHALNIVFDFRKKLINEIEGLKTVILFGSAARGEYTLRSDLDFYIVCEEAGVEVEDQIMDLTEKYDHEFSLIIKSEEQYQKEFSKPVAKLADSIIKEGHSVLYGDSKELDKFIREGFKLGENNLGEGKLGGSNQ